jgi:hypothetical protein
MPEPIRGAIVQTSTIDRCEIVAGCGLHTVRTIRLLNQGERCPVHWSGAFGIEAQGIPRKVTSIICNDGIASETATGRWDDEILKTGSEVASLLEAKALPATHGYGIGVDRVG